MGSGIPISCTVALPHSQILAHSFCSLVFLPAALQISVLLYSYTTASLHSFSYLLLYSRSPVICIPELMYTCIAAFWNSCIFGLMISCFVASLHYYTSASPLTCNPQRCGTLVHLRSFTIHPHFWTPQFLQSCTSSLLCFFTPAILHSLTTEFPAHMYSCNVAFLY